MDNRVGTVTLLWYFLSMRKLSRRHARGGPLQLLKEWHPTWQRQYVMMVDKSDDELNAIGFTFRAGSRVLFCDVHHWQGCCYLTLETKR